MTPEEVPQDLVDAATFAFAAKSLHDGNTGFIDYTRAMLAAVLPLHEQQAHKRVSAMNTRAELAPHGGFTVHASTDTRGPNGELAVYVICVCGRGYSWERKIPGAELVAWLSSHGPDIPLDEENRRVADAGVRGSRDVEARTICPGCDGKGPCCGRCAEDWAEAERS